MPTDVTRETPLDPRARMPYFVNGALENIFFPLLIAFPLCATVVIVVSALFTSGAGCCKVCSLSNAVCKTINLYKGFLGCLNDVLFDKLSLFWSL